MKLRLFITTIFLFLFSFSAFATGADGFDDDTEGTPGTSTPPPPPGGATLDLGAQRKPNVSIDMHSTALFIIGITMISGYYFYSRRRIANP